MRVVLALAPLQGVTLRVSGRASELTDPLHIVTGPVDATTLGLLGRLVWHWMRAAAGGTTASTAARG